jgi:putative glutamine amidotransferase
MQTMNVAAGGTMIQDIPTELYKTGFAEDILKLETDKLHRNYNNHLYIDETLLSGSFHRIQPAKNTLISKLAGENPSPLVYSNHHQCVDDLGLNYSVMARSMDGKIVEALKHDKYENVIGVQFHPEAMRLYNKDIQFRIAPGDPLQTGKKVLQKKNSYQFHVNYWKDFSKRFNELK